MYRMHKNLKVIAVVTIMAAFAVCAVSVQAQAASVGKPKYVLNNSFGMLGINSVAIIKKY